MKHLNILLGLSGAATLSLLVAATVVLAEGPDDHNTSVLARRAELYVSPAGIDTNSGSKNAPLASLEGARALIASRHLAGRAQVTVWVRGGTYHLTQPFHLGPKDSGTEQAPITFRAVPGEEVVLKGSLPLDPKAWQSWKDGIFKQSLDGTALNGREINQLFMSDQRMIRARFPNWDFENPLRTGKGYLHATNEKSMDRIGYSPSDLAGRKLRWKRPQTGIVHAFHVSNWGNFQFRIKDVDWEKHTIHFGEGGWQAQRRYGVGVKHKGQPGSPFYVDNIFEELDAPCEWYLDRETQTLYFKPPDGVDLNNVSVEAAVASRIIECEGAEHLRFEGFRLTQTRTTFLDEYSDLARGDWAIHRGGAVYFRDCQNCSVRDFHIEQVGGNGIFVDGFNREIHISGCLIEDTGDSGVCFVGNPKAVRNYQTWTEKPAGGITDLEAGPKTKDYPANCSVANSIIRDVGVYGKQTSGVIVSMSMDITVDRCSVYRIARAGVTFNDGTWGGHVMSHCDIYDTILDTGEHGPFNAWSRERFWNGKQLRKELVLLDAMKPVRLHHNRVGNYRSGVSAGNWTIDLDDGSSNFEIDKNLMLGSTLKLRDGYFRKVTNNIMVSAVPIGLHCWPRDNSEDVFQRNITVVSGATEGSGRKSTHLVGPAVMPDDHGVWGTFDNNVWWNTNASDFGAGTQASSLAEWQEKQGAHDVFADPLFVDPANGNYQVQPESPAIKLGFENFPMDRFGHQMTRIMQGNREFENSVQVTIRPDSRGGDVHYTLDGSLPTANSPLYTTPLTIGKTTAVRAGTFDAQGREIGFPDAATVTKVKKVNRQSWLASLLAGRYVGPEQAASSSHGAIVPSMAKHELPAVIGQIVRVELSGPKRTLSLAEVEVYSGGQNVALNQKTSQISTAHGGTAQRAVDGNRESDFHKGSVTHTQQNIADPWWEVDLGRPVKIDKVVLVNRDALQSRLDHFTFKILDGNRKVIFSMEDGRQAAQITFAHPGVGTPRSLDWAGLELVTISDFPDYIDASGGQSFGAFVKRIDAESKAAKAGFKNGDTIIRAGSIEVRKLEDLERALKSATGPLTCVVFRSYKRFELTVQP